MPLYEYVCEECAEQFTLLQPIHFSAQDTPCPKCGKKHARRLFSAFSAKTDGSGGSFGSPEQASGGCRARRQAGGTSCGCH